MDPISAVIWLIVMIVIMIVSEILRPKTKMEDAGKAGLGDFNFPTASESRPVSVIWGLVEISAPNVIWYGDLSAIAQKKKIKTGWFSSQNVITGYEYYLGIHMALCSGRVDTLERIDVGERILWTGNVSSDSSISINKSHFYSGMDAGGIVGTFSFKPGDPAAGYPSSYLLSKVSPDYPTHYGISAVVVEHAYIGNSPGIQKMSFFVRRLPTSLSAAYSSVGGYANPANVIYEILTNQQWGACLSLGLLDKPSFEAAAAALYAEDFAFSLQWDNRKTFAELVSEMLRHLDAVLVTNIKTGLLELRLLRKDYTVSLLPLFNEDNIISLVDCAKPSYDETSNELRLVYYDAGQAKERTVIAHDTGNLQMQGAVVSVEKKYIGICTSWIASRVAARDLAVLSRPILKVAFYCDRSAFDLSPGDPFRFSWDAYGIDETVMRAVEVDYGTLTEGRTHIEAMEDISDGGIVVYDSSGYSSAELESSTPVNILGYLQIEAPYALRNLGVYTETTVAEADMAVQLYCATKPTSYTVSYNFYEQDSSGLLSLHDDAGLFCPSGTIYETPGMLKETYTDTYTISIADELGSWDTQADPRSLDGLLYCGGEFMSYTTATVSGIYLILTGIRRGLLDTVPAEHLIGSRVWSMSNSSQLNTRIAATGSVITLAQPVATGGTLDTASCTPRTISFSSRGLRPYPPGNLKFNAVACATTFAGDLSVTWNARNRQSNTGTLWYQTDGDVGAAEAGTTYNIYFYNTVGGGLLRSYTGLTGISQTYLEVDQLADAGGVTLPAGYNVVLRCYRDGYESLQYHEWTTMREV